MGRMFVARDPLGLRPMSWAVDGKLFAAASESVALTNMGFSKVHALEPGQMAIVDNGRLRFERFAKERKHALCFFEWVYFSNVASTLDGSSVYMTRTRSGTRLAELEDEEGGPDSIVVPVPDTAKAAADAFAFTMGIPSVEGLIRNRYIGRTFIEPGTVRGSRVKSKYTALPAVLAGKRVFLIEDSIVRSTTLSTLVEQLREQGQASQIHVRVASPPIVAPCFYGIDMSTLGELFAPRHIRGRYNGRVPAKTSARMAAALGLDSLRYLDVDDLGSCLQIDGQLLCKGCVTGKYPTRCGNDMMRRAKQLLTAGRSGRTYE